MGADHSPYITSFNSDLTEAQKDTYSVHTYPIYDSKIKFVHLLFTYCLKNFFIVYFAFIYAMYVAIRQGEAVNIKIFFCNFVWKL